MKEIIVLTVIACLFPYVFTILAKKMGGFGLKDNQNPRVFLANLQGVASRANAVQQNSFEALPLLIAGVGFAVYNFLPYHLISTLLYGYLFFRILFAWCYLANWSLLRSLAWFLALATNLLLFVLTYFTV